MKYFKKSLCLLLVIALCAGLLIPANASDSFTSSDQVLDLIERYEGFTAYCSGGYIGFGSNYADCVEMFGSDCQPITRAQARQLTRSELASTESYLNSFISRNDLPINQNQFDALMDFSYNCGIGWMYTDSYFRQIILDPSCWDEETIYSAFGTWCKAGGVVLQGLVNRRNEEAELFCSGADFSTGTAYSSVFSDVPLDAWYCDYVEYAYDLGYVNGMGDGTFNPEGSLTRAQAAQLLANFAGADLSYYHYSSYSDISDGAWYAAATSWATACGYINGYSDGTFRPDAAVSRQQFCAIFSRYLIDCGVEYGEIGVSFSDDWAISDYAWYSVYYLSSLGVISGMGDGTFSPSSCATRAQAATILVRLYQVLN